MLGRDVGGKDELLREMVAGVTMSFGLQKRMTITAGDDGNAKRTNLEANQP